MMWNMNPWSFDQHKANAAEKERRARENQQAAKKSSRSSR